MIYVHMIESPWPDGASVKLFQVGKEALPPPVSQGRPGVLVPEACDDALYRMS
jgi:hypothetical protein